MNVVVSLFMMGAGTLGVPRRHWDMAFADASLTHEFPAAAYLMMGLNGVAAIIATVGAVIFLLNIVGTVLWGTKKGAAPEQPEAPAPAPGPVGSYGNAGTLAVPGTFSIAMVFLVAFVLYYFVNWKFLASVWGMS